MLHEEWSGLPKAHFRLRYPQVSSGNFSDLGNRVPLAGLFSIIECFSFPPRFTRGTFHSRKIYGF